MQEWADDRIPLGCDSEEVFGFVRLIAGGYGRTELGQPLPEGRDPINWLRVLSRL
jgi:hypothetical protein